MIWYITPSQRSGKGNAANDFRRWINAGVPLVGRFGQPVQSPSIAGKNGVLPVRNFL
jgi:hypothetical protein